MHKFTLAAVLATCTTAATAASPIDGTWKIDIASAQLPVKPMVRSLSNGRYTCSSCTPKIDVAADGQFHAVSDDPYTDEMSVDGSDPARTVITARKGGRVVYVDTDTLGADGKSLQHHGVDTGTASGTPVEDRATMTRVAAAAPGAHPISGAWRRSKVDAVSDESLTYSYRVSGNSITARQGTGETFTATLGGPAVPIEGDLGGATVAAARAGKGYRFTFTSAGKVMSIATVVVAADGKTASFVSSNPQAGTTTRYTARKI